MAEPVMVVESLKKTFKVGFARKVVDAVRGISFVVEPGEIFGFLGPNGAGKTTTMKMCMDLIRPTSGRVLLFGSPPGSRAARQRIGYLPEQPYFYDYLKPVELLDFFGRLYGVPRGVRRKRIDELIALVGLDHARDRTLRKFSKGMLQRAGLAQALIGDPELVILDEPFSGLDPVNLRGLLDEVQALRDDGRTVVLSTHRMDQVQAFCRDLALLHRGRIVLRGEVAAVRAAHARREYAVGFRGDTGSLTHPGFEVLEQEDERLRVRLREGFTGNDLLALLLERGVELTAFEEILPSIGDIFIERVSDPAPSAERPPAHA